MGPIPRRPKKTEPWRAILLKEKDREVDWILKIQSYRTPFLDRYFSIASMLGEELFYILFLPLSAWAVSSQFAVHLTILLAMSVGIGNILKNVFLIPRPPHPPVWVHTDTEKDHGLPSTHTMTAITLPWYFIIYFNYMDPIYPLHPAVTVLAVLWTLSVVWSRLYNGHHTPMDVAAGAILGVTILAVWTIHLRPLADLFVVSSTLTGAFTLVGTGVSILALHPVPPKVLTPAHAETGLVIGTGTGTCLGLWLSVTHNSRSIHSLWSSTPLQVPLFLAYPLLVYVLRFVVGVIVVGTTRAVVKLLGTSLVLWIARMLNLRYSKSNFKHSDAEVVVKFLTYTAIGFSATWVSPIVFSFLGLHLPLDDVIIPKA